MLIKRIIRVFAAGLTLSLGAALFTGTPADAATQNVATWRVTIRGTVSGRSFTQTGTVALARTVSRVGTTNGVNPVEMCLRVGFPAGTPQTGAIWYGTNSACFPYRPSNVDMAFVSVSGSTVTARADGRLAATKLNNWTSSSSISAQLFSPTSGSATYTINRNGSLSGSINLVGTAGPDGTSRYVATLTGVRTS